MTEDGRDVLNVLRSELEFLDGGGYAPSPRDPLKPPFIFEDSPTCIYRPGNATETSCQACVLVEFVPSEERRRRRPCRHIPLTDEWESAEYFYRWGSEEELEQALASWLRVTIRRIERQRDRVEQTAQSCP
jgi:hypothetical protein